MINIVELFPFKEFRKHQKDVLLKAKDYLELDRNVIISAPVGIGKSPINLALCRYFGSAYYVTPQKILQDQLERDFSDYMAVLKGRDNYVCNMNTDRSCAEGPCMYEYCNIISGKRVCKSCIHTDICPCRNCSYAMAKLKALNSAICCTNLSMFMLADFFKPRRLLVIDEAQNLEDYIISQVEVMLREDETNYPICNNFEDYIEYFRNLIKSIKDNIDRLRTHIKDLVESGVEPEVKDIKRMERLEKLHNKLVFIVSDYEKYKILWVVRHDKFYDKRMKKNVNRVVFQPLEVRHFYNNKIFFKGNKIVICSATPPTSKDLGIECDLIDVPSIFPIKNRQIFVKPIGKMSVEHRKDTIPKIAKEIAKLSIGKTIVHCQSYEIMKNISYYLGGVEHTTHKIQSEGSREEALEDWLNDKERNIFLSVNMCEGIDLAYDKCRTNIIAKCPFPDLTDIRVMEKKKLEPEWYIRKTITKLQQATGRSTRAEDDWSVTYILDSDFNWLYKHYNKYFYAWFKEALVFDKQMKLYV